MTRISVIGSVRFTAAMLETLIDAGLDVVSLVTRANGAGVHSDFADMSELAKQHEIARRAVANINEPSSIEFMSAFKPDIAFCLGWSQLLSAPSIQGIGCPIIGYHPALLPKNRGRHPIIWALALGLKETGSTFFRINEGVDSGDIVSQHSLGIAEDDDAASLYGKILETARKQILEICAEMASGRLRCESQDLSGGNVWRKRSPADGCIDWRMPAKGIYNLTRALRPPYPGATTCYQGVEYRIWRVKPGDPSHSNIEPGYIIGNRQGNLHVKCGDGTIYVTEHDIEVPMVGSYFT